MKRYVLLSVAILLLGAFAASQKVLQRDKELSFIGVKKHDMSKLVVAQEDELEVVHVDGKGQCILECLSHGQCVSMNLASSVGEKKMCHLLKSDIYRAKEGSLVKDSGNTHYSIPVSRFELPEVFQKFR